jgi:5-formyltetrahydrofolate cyclo-ligase
VIHTRVLAGAVSDSTRNPPPFAPDELDALRPRAKAALRKRYRNVRAAIPPAAAAARSRLIAERVIALDAWQGARTVALFRSMQSEVDTAALIEDARARGVTVCLPAVVDGRPELELRVAWRGDEVYPLEAGVWGIEEPAATAPVMAPEAIDLVIVPALAVDPRGHRLGYGRGYYDRTLRLTTRAVAVAVVFDFQLIAEIPCEPHDVAVAWVVTDVRTLRAQPEGRDTPEK